MLLGHTYPRPPSLGLPKDPVSSVTKKLLVRRTVGMKLECGLFNGLTEFYKAHEEIPNF